MLASSARPIRVMLASDLGLGFHQVPDSALLTLLQQWLFSTGEKAAGSDRGETGGGSRDGGGDWGGREGGGRVAWCGRGR